VIPVSQELDRFTQVLTPSQSGVGNGKMMGAKTRSTMEGKPSISRRGCFRAAGLGVIAVGVSFVLGRDLEALA
jgi:hypothetical protein